MELQNNNIKIQKLQVKMYLNISKKLLIVLRAAVNKHVTLAFTEILIFMYKSKSQDKLDGSEK